eukprot:CAMPEP_0114522104 /NCGR_PEP_ID=MMETSP0109-20121206/20566_1 /TAXON_ID=29199 /ORGANISM="Chlorarachnion reptans, Strain CCCM449" /LENGTH=296 /DNA_ID=CAMNT_0001703303 /DNA_START=34 /DNA_END=921 /DNA_ORIENTATION=+
MTSDGGENRDSASIIFWTALLALQVGVQPYLTSQMKSGEVINSAAIIVQEGILKLVFGIQALVLTSGLHSKALQSWSLMRSVRTAGIPSMLYAAQNLLTILAFGKIDGLTYNILNQSKLIWNAVFVYTFLGIKFGPDEIMSLAIIVCTTLLVTADPQKFNAASNFENDGSYIIGVICTLVASLISGVASTVMQYNLQRLKRNPYLMSAELGIYSAFTLVGKISIEAYLGIGDGKRILESSFLHGFTLQTLFPLATTSLGGIVVGQVTLHAGGVGKAYALLAGILVASFLHADAVTW